MYCTQALRRAALVAPRREATLCGDRTQSYTELYARVSKLAGALHAQGVNTGDRVAILSLNSDRYFETFFAVPFAGAVLVPLNIRWSVTENLYSLRDSGTTTLLVDDTFVGVAQAIQAQESPVTQFIYIGEEETPAGMLNYESILAAAMPAEDAMRGCDDLFAIMYTGGTTGFPKGVMISHTNFYSSSLVAVGSLRFNHYPARYLHAAPMFHVADAAMSFASVITAATHVFIPAFSPDATARAIETYGVTDTLLVPTMVAMMLEQNAFANADIRTLRKIVYGASPMPEGTLRKALAQLPDVEFYQAYGQTELAPMGSILAPEYHVFDGPMAGKTRSAGIPGYILDVKIVGADGQALATGGIGEIAMRGPNCMLGYWNKPEQTAQALVDGWVMTGDAGYLDEDGFLFLVDRVKDMIVTGGENVFSAEVESALSQHAAVNEAVVVGIPSEQWGEAVHAIVRLMPDQTATEAAIIEFCHGLIAGYKCPQSVEFREEPFPMTGAGKLRKVDLRKPYWEGHDRSVN
ncbi:long-chain-fatty-acid--CoA ligase [Marinobacter caseinilyticus]|uniref:long-chain-fatty-acid--CoA ligase n=1 Tax=Marinobacter caseinilyticus TaxID=2692195 RepID=UPI00140A24E0|nr:long-chain-fatty-acid--CoA ligase [Marinobacter caseinilyticus]